MADTRTVRVMVRAVDDALQIGGVVFHRHALRMHDREEFGMRLTAASVGPVIIGTLEYRAPVRIQAAEFVDSYQANLPLYGGVRMSYGGREDVASVRRAVVHGPSAPTAIDGWTEPTRLLAVKVFRRGLENTLAAAIGHELDHPIEFQGTVDLERPEGREWAVLARRLRWWAAGGGDDVDLAERTLVDAVMRGLLRAAPHDHSAALRDATAGGAEHAASRALSIMHARTATISSMAELAAEVGVSTRALEKRFQVEWGRSPAEMLRDLRLEYAHRELSRDGTVPVSVVAARWGLHHAGRFSARYAERFGEQPSTTRLRAART